MRVRAIIICSLVLSAWPCRCQAHAVSSQHVNTSVQDFVKNFYAWYVPVALAASEIPARSWDKALQSKPKDFSSQLTLALQDDLRAQNRVTGTIVGLDFDPFLAAQDPCERYDVGRVTRSGKYFRVEVYGICSGVRHAKPDVVAVVARRGDAWVFVNFLYPGNPPGLLKILKLLREERSKH